MPETRHAWRAALVIAALAAACGGSGPAESNTTPASGAAPATPPAGTADACSLLTREEIAAAVGNPVEPGRPEAGRETCDWDTAQPGQTDVLLMVRLKGSTREQVLCDEMRKTAAAGKGYSGIGEAATWKYTKGGIFDSADLEVCDGKGFVSISLNGKGDAAALEAAAVALARKVLGRL
jgi:hypothetical protein